MYKIISIFSVFLIITGFALIIIFTFNSSFNDGSGILNPDLASKYGSFIGGLVGSIFSLAGILLILENLIVQRRISYSQQFENKLFELIRYHRENVNHIETALGHNAMVLFKENIEAILRKVKWFTVKNFFEEENKDRDQIRIAYIFFFYGLENHSINSIKKILPEYNQPEVYDDYTKIDIIFEAVKESIENDKNYSIEGHQEVLGHYFRHLYQSFMFIKDAEHLNKKQKYGYAKMLRAQLSTFEQAILFYNIMSPVGQTWVTNNLVNGFQLIKNIPPYFLDGINPKDYFPQIKFEWESLEKA